MDLRLIEHVEDENDFIAWINTTPRAAIDTETTGLDPWHDELRMVQFGDTETGWALPFPEERELIDWGLRNARDTVYHHWKFDTQFQLNNDLPTRSPECTKIALHLLDSSSSTGLKENSVRLFGDSGSRLETALHQKMRASRWTWATVPKDLPEYWMYAAFDTVLTSRIADVVLPLVREKYAALYETELGVALAVSCAEQRGVLLDQGYARTWTASLQEEIEEIREQWPGINLNAPAQVGTALESAGFSLPRTKSGKVQATADLLEEIDHPLAKARLQLAAASKNLETYFENFLRLVDPAGYVHPTINTIGPRTGRMSSERPNLQNVPKDSFVRPAFVASPGHVLVMADYSQIEYRIFASLANEPSMIEAFLDGKDMHAETARIVYGHEPSAGERSTAKNANFSQLFGAGTNKFAWTAGIPYAEADAFMKKYRDQFPQVRRFMDAVIRYAKSNGYAVETSYGRRCPVDHDQLYAGVNYMVQGSAADVLKRAIVRVADSEWGQYFVLPIHDELMFDIPEEAADDLVRDLPDLMEEREKFAVPLTVSIKRQHRWGRDDEEVEQAA